MSVLAGKMQESIANRTHDSSTHLLRRGNFAGRPVRQQFFLVLPWARLQNTVSAEEVFLGAAADVRQSGGCCSRSRCYTPPCGHPCAASAFACGWAQPDVAHATRQGEDWLGFRPEGLVSRPEVGTSVAEYGTCYSGKFAGDLSIRANVCEASTIQ